MYNIILISGLLVSLFGGFLDFVSGGYGSGGNGGNSKGLQGWTCACFPPNQLQYIAHNGLIDPRIACSRGSSDIRCPRGRKFGCIDLETLKNRRLKNQKPQNRAAIEDDTSVDEELELELETTTTAKPLKPDMCGIQLTSDDPSHTPAGYETGVGKYPWVVGIYSDQGFLGTGALLDNRHVLTVAHRILIFQEGKTRTVQEISPRITVRLGDWNYGGNDERYKCVESKVESIKIHPQFRKPIYNNLAIITLKNPLNLTILPHIDRVCLPAVDENFIKKSCWISGWGKDTIKGNQNLKYLHESNLIVWTKDECTKSLSYSNRLINDVRDKSILCAGSDSFKKTSCIGDTGAPLVCEDSKGQFYLAGVMIVGSSCGELSGPHTFASVSSAIDWIKPQLV